MLASSFSLRRAAGHRALSTSAAPQAYIAHSPIPTFKFQDSLPRLPIPTLEETCKKYVYFTEPLLNPEQLAATRKAVADFQAGPGPFLQNHLTTWDKAHKHTSYISGMWYDMYLQTRDPLPLNLNPQLTWLDHPDRAKNEQAVRAADMIHGAARFYLTLEAEKLEPDVYHTNEKLSKNKLFQGAVGKLVPRSVAWYAAYLAKAYPLDMSQYARLFKSTRIPKRGQDELRSADRAHARHVVVQRGPRFYRIEAITADGQIVPAAAIEAQLRAILAELPAPVRELKEITSVASDGGFSGHKGEEAPVSWAAGGALKAAYAAEPPVGALTGLHRDEWADARDALVAASPLNAASLEAIDSSLFVLTLEHECPESHEDLSRAMLHGDGRNRWFDKCFNVIVCGNGKAGIAWEHAWGDGVAVLYFFNELFRLLNGSPHRAPAAPAPLTDHHRLRFDFSSSDQGKKAAAAVRRAESYTDGVIASTALNVYQSQSMTKEDIKRSRLAPDGVMQMILQLAHWRAHGYTPATYESASTAGFKHGRTEVIRSATPEAVAMCKAFSDATTSHEQRYAALSAATSQHKKISFDAVMGKGVDRHLYALQQWAQRLRGQHPSLPADGPVPAIFTDPGYAIFKDIRLSTSTLASPALQGGGFGPVSNHSYGVGYGVEERGAHFHVMSYATPTSRTDNKAFITAVETALQDFHKTITAASPKAGEGKRA